jgi:hypothetical protein
MAATAFDDQVEISVLPFTIEADGPRNDDLLIQCIPGCKLRSAISGMKTVIDKDGNESVPTDQAIAMADFPKTPGMQLHVNPGELSYVISDPLRDNEAIRERLQRWIENRTKIRTREKIRGVDTVSGKLDAHRMKSLCREMLQLVESGYARCVKGAVPTMEDIEELPGNFLLNPGSRVFNMQPMFEKDWDEWIATLGKL